MKVLFSTFYFLFSKKGGQAALSLVFIIGGIIVTIGLTLAFLAESFVNSAYGFQVAQRAQAVASAGAYDALQRLNRSKDLSSNYSVPLGDDNAGVSVAQNSPAAGFVTIVSSSTVSRRSRTVTVTVSRNATSGEISLVSWE